jgi:outer membrane lipoprotein
VVPENIQIADETQLVSYEQVVSTGVEMVSKPARWGGLIADVENKKDGTFIEIVHFPLNHYGKPSVANESTGRFKVKMEGFLDPVVFESGRAITFTGQVSEPIEGAVGEQTYIYPALDGDSYHLWRKERVYDVTNVNYNMNGVWGPGWGPGWNGPFLRGRPFGWGAWGPWGGWGFGPTIQQSRVRVVERAPRSSAKGKTKRLSNAFYGNKSDQKQPIQNDEQ